MYRLKTHGIKVRIHNIAKLEIPIGLLNDLAKEMQSEKSLITIQNGKLQINIQLLNNLFLTMIFSLEVVYIGVLNISYKVV